MNFDAMILACSDKQLINLIGTIEYVLEQRRFKDVYKRQQEFNYNMDKKKGVL